MKTIEIGYYFKDRKLYLSDLSIFNIKECVYLALKEYGELSLKELAYILGKHASWMSVNVNIMEKSGIIRSRYDVGNFGGVEKIVRLSNNEKRIGICK